MMLKIKKPQLAKLVSVPPQGEEWIHEIKLDGYRIISYLNNDVVSLITRNQKDYTLKFPNVAMALKKLKLKTTILDGEVVILDKNHRSDFQLLQNAMDENEIRNTFHYFVFDILQYEGDSLLNMPLIERKKILRRVIGNKKGVLVYSDHIIGDGKEIFAKACEMGLEGIISKKAQGIYVQNRSYDWLKTKCVSRQEFLICGYTEPKNTRSHFGALVLGYYDKNKKLIYVGRVGTGFTQQSLAEMNKLLQQNKTNVMPFKERPPESKRITWIKPVLIAEVEYREITRDGILRQPSFKGLRKDKSPKSITLDKPLT